MNLDDNSYGRIPPETIEIVRQAAGSAGRIVGEIGERMPAAWSEFAFDTVLRGILADWVKNGTSTLYDADEDDLRQMLLAAVDIANEAVERQETIFRRVLEGLVQDWVENWNTEDDIEAA
jgi:hypothetical protein